MDDLILEKMVKSMLIDMEAMKEDAWGGEKLLVREWYNLWWHYERISGAYENRKKERSVTPNEEGSFRVQGQLY